MHDSITIDRVADAVQFDDLSNPGFCLACGASQGGCEPDARNYECEDCGKHQVFGAEEILLNFC